MSQLNMFGPAKPVKPFSGTLIYTPKGRAREYAALACNVYKGCDHKCTYCYAPSATFKSRDEFTNPATRSNFLTKLEKEAAKHQAAGTTGRVLLSFTCDPYQHLDETEHVTRLAIEILHRYSLDVQVLTKGGSRALRDIDLFTPRDAFATTLTFLDLARSLHWEPNAATPPDRIETIKHFRASGIPTWVSLEPVIDPNEARAIICATHEFVDLFKVGKLNYHPHAQSIDWQQFALDAIQLLTSLGYTRSTDHDNVRAGQFYIKRDLAAYLVNTPI